MEARCATTMPVVSAQHPAQRLLDELLGVHVERGEGVVEDQDARLGEHGAGQREPLPLAAGQRHALLADPGVEAPGQVVDELGLRDLERLARRRRRWRRGRPSSEVLPGAHREQRRLLEGGRDDLPQVGQLQVAHVDPVDGDRGRR